MSTRSVLWAMLCLWVCLASAVITPNANAGAFNFGKADDAPGFRETFGIDPDRLSRAARECRMVEWKVRRESSPDNTYSLSLEFEAREAGTAVHEEDLHVNLIHRRTIAVDGKLDDWKGTLPQPIRTEEAASRSLTEAMWLPFENFQAGRAGGLATGYLAYEDQFLYFATKVAEEYGGGTEIGRLQAPGLPHKHFRPRQPAHAKEGPVQTGRLAIVHAGNTCTVEVALPWEEIPHVKGCLEAGRPVKFSFCVNHNTRGPRWSWPETAVSPSRTARRSTPTGPNTGLTSWNLLLRDSVGRRGPLRLMGSMI